VQLHHAPPHRSLVAAAKQRGAEAESGCRRRHQMHAQGNERARGILVWEAAWECGLACAIAEGHDGWWREMVGHRCRLGRGTGEMSGCPTAPTLG
jgi:hypothetical protein